MLVQSSNNPIIRFRVIVLEIGLCRVGVKYTASFEGLPDGKGLDGPESHGAVRGSMPRVPERASGLPPEREPGR